MPAARAALRSGALLLLVALAAACASAPPPAGDATPPVGPEGLEGDL
jgi:hypothetical protein